MSERQAFECDCLSENRTPALQKMCIRDSSISAPKIEHWFFFILNFSHADVKAGFFSKKTADQFDQLLLNAVLRIFRCTLMILAIDSERCV